MANILPYIGIIICICFSAFFSGSEIAYASANTLRLKTAAENGSKSSALALYICNFYDKALCTILIGNNLVNIASSSLATVIAMDLVGNAGAVYATGVMTVLILIFGEIVPKILAKDHCSGFVLVAATPLRFLMFITKPLVHVITWIIDKISLLWGGDPEPEPITPDELMTIIETVEDEGVIDEERSELLQSAIGFGETTIEEILTPRVDLLTIDLSSSREEILKIMEDSAFSRLPVYDEDVDSIIGIIYLNHAYRVLVSNPDTTIRDLITPAFFLHRSTRLPVALKALRERNLQMAVVLDDFGGTCGVVTLEDILEEIVGDIWDESDPIENEFQQLDDTHFRISGSMAFDDLLWELDLDQFEDEVDAATVGGWVTEVLERFPEIGDTFTWKNLNVTVEALEDMRVTQIELEVLPPIEPENDDE